MEVYRIEEDNLDQLTETEFSTEKKLENYLIRAEGAQIGGVDVLYIGQQGSPGEGGIFDLVGVDEEGNVVIIELKRGRSPRDIVAQALEYAAGIRNEGFDQLEHRYQEFVDDEDASLQSKHTEYFSRGDDPLSEREYNAEQRLVLVGTDFSKLSLDMADFLREHDIDVICVTYSSFTSDGEGLQLLTTEAVRRPLAEEPSSISGGEQSSWKSTVDILDGDTTIRSFDERNQSDALESVVNYLIEEHGLLEEIDIPYRTGRGTGSRALINDVPEHPNGDTMSSYRAVSSGYYVLTKLGASRKQEYINDLSQKCGLNARVDM